MSVPHGTPAATSAAEAAALRVTYVGHATVLLELDGARILTDPVLRDRIVHLRARRRPSSADALEPLDLVLLSHAHRDHLDVRSLRRIGAATRVIAPPAVVRALRRRGYGRPVEPVEAGDVRTCGSVAVRATPARHGRPGSAVGYVVTGSMTVYFAGDTDLFPELKGLADPLDVALLPIWGWGPHVGAGHLDPDGAVEAIRLLRPRIVVPIHWGTLHPIGRSRAAFLDEPAETCVQ
ncbi:MAG TPA: MBL fold metallo-hydrolase, partial [Gaiellaceae bacterium]|nr:MBL fold metallo-hydrolase [Gaiellaceae bacterium]